MLFTPKERTWTVLSFASIREDPSDSVTEDESSTASTSSLQDEAASPLAASKSSEDLLNSSELFKNNSHASPKRSAKSDLPKTWDAL